MGSHALREPAEEYREPAARAVDLVKTYGEGDTQVVALDGVNVEFAANQFTAIMGPSGSGKSTHALHGGARFRHFRIRLHRRNGSGGAE